MADDVEAKVVTAPAAAATASAASVIDYALLVANAPVMAAAVVTTPHAHVARARALWLVLAGLRPQARLQTVLIGDLESFARSGRSTGPGFMQLADAPNPGFFAWTNSGREVLVSPRLFGFAAGTNGVSLDFVNAVALRLLDHEAAHVRQFLEEGGPPSSYKGMGDFEVDAYTETRQQVAQVPAASKGERKLLKKWDASLGGIIEICAKAGDAKTEEEALTIFRQAQMLPPAAERPPSTLYVPTP